MDFLHSWLINFPSSSKALITPWLFAFNSIVNCLILLTKKTTKFKVVWRFERFMRNHVETRNPNSKKYITTLKKTFTKKVKIMSLICLCWQQQNLQCTLNTSMTNQSYNAQWVCQWPVRTTTIATCDEHINDQE